jgi:hypothetical protein
MSVEERQDQIAKNATSGSLLSGLKRIASWFSPAIEQPQPSMELPNIEPFKLAIHFQAIGIIFDVTKDNCAEFMKDLQDPYCKGFFFQCWWINKELICGVQVYDDNKSVPPNSDSQRSERQEIPGKERQNAKRALDGKEQTPQNPTAVSNPNLTTAAEWDKIARTRDPMPRGSSHVR